MLGLSYEIVRDDLLGDAVILSFQPGPPGRPDQGRGVLLVRPRDRAWSSAPESLERRTDEIRRAGGRRGTVEGVPVLQGSQVQTGRSPLGNYILLDDGSFAWSNSEALIQGVIDREWTPGSGLGDDPSFQKVRRGLPDRPFISLFVNPRVMGRVVLDGARSGSPAGSSLGHAGSLPRRRRSGGS